MRRFARAAGRTPQLMFTAIRVRALPVEWDPSLCWRLVIPLAPAQCAVGSTSMTCIEWLWPSAPVVV